MSKKEKYVINIVLISLTTCTFLFNISCLKSDSVVSFADATHPSVTSPGDTTPKYCLPYLTTSSTQLMLE